MLQIDLDDQVRSKHRTGRGFASVAQKVMSRAELAALPPAIDLVTAGRALGIGRSKTYELVKGGAFPVKVLRLGNSYRVVTADLLLVLGIKQEAGDA